MSIVSKTKRTIKHACVALSKRSPKFSAFYQTTMHKRRLKHYLEVAENTSVDDKTIVFQSFMGRKYVCSPKAIYEEMLKEDLDYHYIWAFRGMELVEKHQFLTQNKNTEVVRYGSREYLEACAKAKYWITNSRLPNYLQPKENQVFIQCWHGTPLKKLGCDIEKTDGNALYSIEDIHRDYRYDSKRFSYIVSPSPYCTEKFTSAFDIKDKHKVLEVGYPRNDYLYTYTQDDVESIKKELHIPQDKKVILYAPTWRDNQHSAKLGYTYQLGIDFSYLQKYLSQEYVILFRAHYFVANQIDLTQYEGFVYNVSTYDDINRLYVISDLLITDYSSVFFDYSNLRRPMFYYMYDYNEYKKDIRDFYFDLEELPGPISQTQEDLVKDILDIDHYEEKYREKYKKFNDKFTPWDDGKAAYRLVQELILKDK